MHEMIKGKEAGQQVQFQLSIDLYTATLRWHWDYTVICKDHPLKSYRWGIHVRYTNRYNFTASARWFRVEAHWSYAVLQTKTRWIDPSQVKVTYKPKFSFHILRVCYTSMWYNRIKEHNLVIKSEINVRFHGCHH